MKSRLVKKLKKLARKDSSFLRSYFIPSKGNKFSPIFARKRTIISLAIAILLSNFLITKLSSFPAQAYLAKIDKGEIVELTNKFRKENDLPALRPNEALEKAAYLKAENILDLDYWSHTSPNGKEPWDFVDDAEYKWAEVGENLAKGFLSSNEVVEAWKESQKHRENLLNKLYREIGIAVVPGKIQGKRVVLVVQIFAKPSLDANKSGSKNNLEALRVKKKENLNMDPPNTSASPSGGTFYKSISVELENDDKATIYYTLNGKEPDKNSKTYRKAIKLQASRVLKFFAVSSDGTEERVRTEKYLIKKERIPDPIILNPSDKAYIAKEEIEIKGRVYAKEKIAIKIDSKTVTELMPVDDKYNSFSFNTNLSEGKHEISIELKSGKTSSTNTFIVDLSPPVIDLTSLELEARQDLNTNYYLRFQAKEELNKVELRLPEKTIELIPSSDDYYEAIFMLEKAEVLATLYIEDFAHNSSSETFQISGNIGETLGVSTGQNSSFVSENLKTGIRSVSIMILLLLGFSFGSLALLNYTRGLKYKSKHEATHALIVTVVALILIFI